VTILVLPEKTHLPTCFTFSVKSRVQSTSGNVIRLHVECADLEMTEADDGVKEDTGTGVKI
jgi:hypothetical protein